MPQTGATRYQKFLRSEKAKTKLKSKKELPKGTNITKTNFKVKKIIIKEQLKRHTFNEALSTRKLNIKDLISRLNHFNVHSRTEALNGVKEIITTYPDVLQKSLGELIHGVTPLVLNIEKTVRRESLKVLHLILSNASIENTEPFFDYMSTYLRSAMTHIDNRIQEDSLLFLDVLLLCAAERIVRDIHKILPNFLDMISKMRVETKPGRALTVNLDSKVTSVKWRVKVLHRLQQFLHKYVNMNVIQKGTETTLQNFQFFNESKFNNYSLHNSNFTANCYIGIFSINSESLSVDEIEKFNSYIETLMPLLFETWIEVCPTLNSNSNIETILTEDTAILLKHIIQVISLIWELLVHLEKINPSSNIKYKFCNKYRKSFAQHIFRAFPYVTNIRSNKSKEVLNKSIFEETISDPKMVEENLMICHLFILTNQNINMKTQSHEITAALNFIEKTFMNKTENDDINKLVIKILHSIFSDELTGWTRNQSLMDGLLKKIVSAYFNTNKPQIFHEDIFSLLCKTSLNEKLSHFHENESYNKWIKKLPDILLEDTITVQTIDILHRFAVCNNNVFNQVLKSKLLQIVENLSKIKISDSLGYNKLFSLLYWIKVWDHDSLNLLEKQILQNKYSADHCKFIVDTLRFKSTGTFE